MSHFKAKMHRIRFMGVPFVRFCLRWSSTHTTKKSVNVFSNIDGVHTQAEMIDRCPPLPDTEESGVSERRSNAQCENDLPIVSHIIFRRRPKKNKCLTPINDDDDDVGSQKRYHYQRSAVGTQVGVSSPRWWRTTPVQRRGHLLLN